MNSQRQAILDAKRHLYHLILQLKFGDMTNDDINIGMVLVQDSEIQKLLERKK